MGNPDCFAPGKTTKGVGRVFDLSCLSLLKPVGGGLCYRSKQGDFKLKSFLGVLVHP